MLAASAKPLSEGRALKGGLLLALPLWMIAARRVGGAALTARALYIPLKAEVAQVLLARAFDQSLEQGTPVKPWSWADTAPVSRVRVERLGVSEIVLSGGSGEAMAFGPTEVFDDRARGVTVLAAHRDTHFEFVRDLQAGDLVTLDRIDGTSETYRVRGFETVRFDEFTYPAHGGSGLLALTTCWPFGSQVSGPMRRVAWAEKLG